MNKWKIFYTKFYLPTLIYFSLNSKHTEIMVIDEKTLEEAGAMEKTYETGDMVFSEGDFAQYYYQIKEGKIKLNNYNEEGTEFLQNILHDGQSFGESLLFIDRPYPMNAEAMMETTILMLPKNHLFSLIASQPEVAINISRCMSERLYFKYMMLQNNAIRNPIKKIWSLLNYLKSFSNNHAPQSFKINFTRQQLASMTGLTIETVIRSIKILEKEKKLIIKNRKVYI